MKDIFTEEGTTYYAENDDRDFFPDDVEEVLSVATENNRLKATVAKVLYFGDMWGIISVEPKEIYGEFSPELNHFNNFVIRGAMPFCPNEKQILDIEVSDLQRDPKRNNAAFYEVIRVHMDALDSVESQQRFLSAILSEHRAKLILDAYPDAMIIDDIREGKINLKNIKGIGNSTAQDVKDAIANNKDMGALMAELVDLNLTGNMLKKIVDKFVSSTRALFKVKESLYNLCSISGISFKRVDDAALARGEDREGSKRIKAYSEHYFDEIANQGHSWVNEKVFLKQSLEDLSINANVIRRYMESEDGKEFFYWQQGDQRISSRRMYNNEKTTLKNLLRLKNKYEPIESLNIDGTIANAEDLLGLKYTNEQKEAVKEALKHGVFVLNGKGGTGKSTIIKCIVEVLEASHQIYTACALSGKASQVLLSKGINSGTIHRTFGIGMSNKEKEKITGEDTEDMGESYNNVDVFIIDETSMVNAGIFAEITSKMKDGAKVILVGDSGQLSAIGHGDVLRDLLCTDYFPKFELQQIHRQAQDSGIIEVASMIREGKNFIPSNFEGNKSFGKNKDMLVFGYTDKELIPNDLIKVLTGQAKKILEDRDLLDYQVVVAMKERGDLSVRAINILSQSIFNDLDKIFVSHGGYDYRVGDKVIVKGNSYSVDKYDDLDHYENVKLFGFRDEEDEQDNKSAFREEGYSADTGDLFNGTMGIILKIESVYNIKNKKDDEFLIVEFEGFGIRVLEKNELSCIELAYAATCHRLQGSTIKNVVVVLDYSAFALLSRQWVYTAITRASKKCVLMVQSAALAKSINTDSSGNRNTFLGDLIRMVENMKR